jgi:hypothetical protein
MLVCILFHPLNPVLLRALAYFEGTCVNPSRTLNGGNLEIKTTPSHNQIFSTVLYLLPLCPGFLPGREFDAVPCSPPAHDQADLHLQCDY